MIGLSCERPLWSPMWNPALTKVANLDDGWGVNHLLTMSMLNLKKNSKQDPGLSYGGGQSSFDHTHVESLKKNSRWDPGLLYCGGGQSSFDHAHVESLKKILDEILVCHMGILNFFKDSTCTWSKDDWPPPPQYNRPGSHLEFFFKDSTCVWSKDDWPP